MKKTCIALMALLSSLAMADAPSDIQPPSEKWKWSFGLDLGSIMIDSETAEQEGIEDSAVLFGGSAHYGSKNWLASAGMDIIFYEDNASFRQEVENNFSGDRSTEDSDADGLLLSLAFGPRWQLAEDKVELLAQLGFAGMASSERSISNCSNCFSEDINVDGGLYSHTGAKYNFDGFAVGISGQYFLSGDLDASVRLTVSTEPF